MASVSYGLNRRADQSPERITVGTLAVTTNDVELRWNNSLTNPLQRREIIDILGRSFDALRTVATTTPRRYK